MNMYYVYEDIGNGIKVFKIKPIKKLYALSKDYHAKIIDTLQISTYFNMVCFVDVKFVDNYVMSIDDFAYINFLNLSVYKNSFIIPHNMNPEIVTFICNDKILTNLFLEWPAQIYLSPLFLLKQT